MSSGLKSIERQTKEAVAAWEEYPFRCVRGEMGEGFFKRHIEWLREQEEKYGGGYGEHIPMYEAVIAVIERRWREGR